MRRSIAIGFGINRIRLEFKARFPCSSFVLKAVLIESDWNLKVIIHVIFTTDGFRINRIRLEFKVAKKAGVDEYVLVLIESDWNLKETSA